MRWVRDIRKDSENSDSNHEPHEQHERVKSNTDKIFNHELTRIRAKRNTEKRFVHGLNRSNGSGVIQIRESDTDLRGWARIGEEQIRSNTEKREI